jgi:hypothetical protein
MQVDPNRSEDVLKMDSSPDTGEGGDDAYDCLRYGVMASRGNIFDFYKKARELNA